MSRFINPFPQFADLNLAPLVGGTISFYETGTTNLKTIYTDVELVTPAENPQTLDSYGMTEQQVFLGSGDYNIVLKDVFGQIIKQVDPVSKIDSSSGQFSNWDSTVIYNTGDVVRGPDGEYYKSETDGNINNDPVVDNVNWTRIELLSFWNPNVTYNSIDIVIGSNGNIYKSKVNNNLGNNPTSSPDEWGPAFDITSQTINVALPRGYKDGYIMSNDINDLEHDITIASGSAKSLSGTLDIVRSATLTKSIDTEWVEGDLAGGFPSGLSLSPNTWYHFFVIVDDLGNVDAGFDSDLSATNLLADATNYIGFRRVGSVLTDGVSNIRRFLQTKNKFLYYSKVVATTSQAAFPSDLVVNTPLGIRTTAIMGGGAVNIAGSDTTYILGVKGLTDNNFIALHAPAVGSSEENPFGYAEVLTDTLSTILAGYGAGGAVDSISVETLGWIDDFES